MHTYVPLGVRALNVAPLFDIFVYRNQEAFTFWELRFQRLGAM